MINTCNTNSRAPTVLTKDGLENKNFFFDDFVSPFCKQLRGNMHQDIVGESYVVEGSDFMEFSNAAAVHHTELSGAIYRHMDIV